MLRLSYPPPYCAFSFLLSVDVSSPSSIGTMHASRSCCFHSWLVRQGALELQHSSRDLVSEADLSLVVMDWGACGTDTTVMNLGRTSRGGSGLGGARGAVGITSEARHDGATRSRAPGCGV